MIYNERLDRLIEIDAVRSFMQKNQFHGKLCSEKGKHSYILYRYPYVIVFFDALIENYLEIFLIDINGNLLLKEGSMTACAVELGLQNREDLRSLSFSGHMKKDIFLSDGDSKMYGLHTTLEAIDKLLPLIEAKGGLFSLRDGTFDSRFDFSDLAVPIFSGLKEHYRNCIDQTS